MATKLSVMVIDLSKPVKAYFTDDDLDDFELFYDAVVTISKNIELVPFSSCELLLARLKESSPDILFIDINLGSMTGIECLQEIKSMPHLIDVPKVVMSTSVSKVKLEECYQVGCNHFFQKPSSFDEAINEMRRIFEKDWLTG